MHNFHLHSLSQKVYVHLRKVDRFLEMANREIRFDDANPMNFLPAAFGQKNATVVLLHDFDRVGSYYASRKIPHTR